MWVLTSLKQRFHPTWRLGLRIEELNALPEDDVAEALRACVRIESWVHALTTGRPYDDADQLLRTARALADSWTPAEVEGALADHPRIGERPSGSGATAVASAREQAGVDPADAELAEALRRGNAAYEQRFGRTYLVRAKGRTGPELLALLEQRLGNEPDDEYQVMIGELRDIALLRVKDLVS